MRSAAAAKAKPAKPRDDPSPKFPAPQPNLKASTAAAAEARPTGHVDTTPAAKKGKLKRNAEAGVETPTTATGPRKKKRPSVFQRLEGRDDLRTLDPLDFGLPESWTVVGAPQLSPGQPGKTNLEKYFKAPDGLETDTLHKAMSYSRIFETGIGSL